MFTPVTDRVGVEGATPQGISNAGVVVGYYFDASGNPQSFELNPARPQRYGAWMGIRTRITALGKGANQTAEAGALGLGGRRLPARGGRHPREGRAHRVW